MQTIGFAGTAKNTGKTTASLQVLAEGRAAGYRIALTSIGYDGELKDNVTGLPKPRYFLEPGDWIATSEKCLQTGTAQYQIHSNTGIQTVLGNVFVAEITAPGRVVLAGPNRQKDLARVLDHFISLGVNLTLVDGALNRLVPMIVADGLVLSTGAAFNPDVDMIADHVHAIGELFTYPTEKEVGGISQNSSTLFFKDGDIRMLDGGSLLSTNLMNELAEIIDKPLAFLCIPNACSPKLLYQLIDQRKRWFLSAQLVLGNPLKLIASGDPCSWMDLKDQTKLRISYIKSLPLYLITVNPYYPRYLPGYYTYEPATIDKLALLASVRAAASPLPVFDIKQDLEQLLPHLISDDSKKG